MLTEYEQYEATELIKKREYARGFKAGYKAKEKELRKYEDEMVERMAKEDSMADAIEEEDIK